jgi:uncharacterized membrane protein
MGLVLAATFGFAVWIVLWSLGAKGFDGFMITVLILVLGAASRIVTPLLPGNRDR